MFDKISSLIEQLSDELVNFNVLISNNKIKDVELNQKEITLTEREKKVAIRESMVLGQIHKIEEDRKQYNIDIVGFDNKQDKFQKEWQRMTEEREKLSQDQEYIAREKLILETRKKEIEKAKSLLVEKEQGIKKQTDGIQDLSQMLKLKEEKLKKDRNKVDKYLGSI